MDTEPSLYRRNIIRAAQEGHIHYADESMYPFGTVCKNNHIPGTTAVAHQNRTAGLSMMNNSPLQRLSKSVLQIQKGIPVFRCMDAGGGVGICLSQIYQILNEDANPTELLNLSQAPIDPYRLLLEHSIYRIYEVLIDKFSFNETVFDVDDMAIADHRYNIFSQELDEPFVEQHIGNFPHIPTLRNRYIDLILDRNGALYYSLMNRTGNTPAAEKAIQLLTKEGAIIMEYADRCMADALQKQVSKSDMVVVKHQEGMSPLIVAKSKSPLAESLRKEGLRGSGVVTIDHDLIERLSA